MLCVSACAYTVRRVDNGDEIVVFCKVRLAVISRLPVSVSRFLTFSCTPPKVVVEVINTPLCILHFG